MSMNDPQCDGCRSFPRQHDVTHDGRTDLPYELGTVNRVGPRIRFSQVESGALTGCIACSATRRVNQFVEGPLATAEPLCGFLSLTLVHQGRKQCEARDLHAVIAGSA